LYRFEEKGSDEDGCWVRIVEDEGLGLEVDLGPVKDI